MSEARSIDRIKQTIEAEAVASSSAQPVRPASFDKPAVGLLASSESADALAGSILRAHRAGHQTLVAYDPRDVKQEALEFANELGATVVKPRFNRWDDEEPVDLLAKTAREYGFPGVIHQTDVGARVDYAASSRQLQEASGYLVEAAPEPAVAGRVEVLVGIPAYNEAGTIGDVVSRAAEHGKVLVVDDGSEDETVAVARKAGATVVKHETNRGYGAALKTIFREADRSGAERLVIMDGDGQHEPGDIPKLVDRQDESGAEVVIGSRFTKDAETDAPLYRLFGLFIVNLLTNLSLGVLRPGSRVRDTQSGFRAYDRRAIESMAPDDGIGDRMSASTDILYHAHHNDFQIEEVGTSVYYDVEEGSNQNPVSHGVTLVSNILKTIERDRPVTSLGIPGFASVLLGGGFAYWTVAQFLSSGTFPLGLALVSTFFVLAGIFASFTAIILHSLNQHL